MLHASEIHKLSEEITFGLISRITRIFIIPFLIAHGSKLTIASCCALAYSVLHILLAPCARSVLCKACRFVAIQILFYAIPPHRSERTANRSGLRVPDAAWRRGRWR